MASTVGPGGSGSGVVRSPQDDTPASLILSGFDSLNLLASPDVWGRTADPESVELLVCLPAYTEEGYTLDRSLEALAMQAVDWRNASGAPVQIHVLVIFDGFDKVDPSMWTSIGRAYGGASGDDVKQRVSDVFDQGAQFCALQWGSDLSHSSSAGSLGALSGFGGGATGVGASIAARDLRLSPLDIDCRSAMLSDAREQSDLSPITTFPVELRAWLGREGAPEGPTPSWAEMQARCRKPLLVTSVVKKQNAKKFHSHRLFFEGWLPLQKKLMRVDPEFLFCSDVGTLYGPRMLYILATYMRQPTNARVAACCAHQRIMTYLDQADPDPKDVSAESSFAGMLRQVQAFDFESGLAVFNGIHALLGFLPVIPGPCGFLRRSAVSDEILGEVRRIVSNPTERDSLIQGNLKIAEDRILSYLLLFGMSTGRGWQTHWVPDALFYFESEGALDEFVPQRRRWLNGTTSGYLWLVFYPRLWASCAMCSPTGAMAFKIFFMCLLQLLVFGIVFIMPAFMGLTGYLALGGLGALFTAWGMPSSDNRYVKSALQTTYWILYIGSFSALVIHTRWFPKWGLGKGEKVLNWLWNFRVVLNAFIMFLNVFVLLGLVVTSFVAEDSLSSMSAQDIAFLRFIFAFTVFYSLSPFFLGLMHSWRSFKTMLDAFQSYYLFLPTILSDFFAYSIAKYDDWSWGTREAVPSKADGSAGGPTISAQLPLRAAEELVTQKIRARSQRSARSMHQATTSSLVIIQLGLAIFLVVFSLIVEIHINSYFIIVGFAMTGVGLFLMLSSFLYYLIRSRSSYSGQTHTPVVRVAITLVVMLSWLGGMALLLMFAPINADRVITAKHFHSYLVSFTCLFVLVIFIAIKGAYERSKKNSVDDKQMAQSIAEALRRFAAPDAEAGTGGALGGLPQAQPRPYTAQRPRAGMRDPAAAPSHGGITLTYAELRNLALDAKEIRQRELSTCGNLCVGLAASVFLPFAPIIVFATAIVTAILRALINLCCSCTGADAPATRDRSTRAPDVGVSLGNPPARRAGGTGRGSVLQEPLIAIN